MTWAGGIASVIGATVGGGFGLFLALSYFNKLIASNPENAFFWILFQYLSFVVAGFVAVVLVLDGLRKRPYAERPLLSGKQVEALGNQKRLPIRDEYSVDEETTMKIDRIRYLADKGLVDVMGEAVGEAEVPILDTLKVKVKATDKKEKIDLGKLHTASRPRHRITVESAVETGGSD